MTRFLHGWRSMPLTSDPSLASVIAEGALLRLHAGARCFERYRQELWGRERIVANFEYAEDSAVRSEREAMRSNEPSGASNPVLRAVSWRRSAPGPIIELKA